MKVLIFAGAGTSAEMGVPTMAGMATEFRAHSQQWGIEPDTVASLLSANLDIEPLIEALDQISAAKGAIAVFGGTTVHFAAVDKIRAEVEWFVQHAAERVVPAEAHLVWGGVLRLARVHDLVFATTNYDRAIELAANAEGVPLSDGFGAFGDGEVSEWRSFTPLEGQAQLIKLHGSTDWYSDGHTGAPCKLRHPMPLFNRARLQLRNDRILGSALVLPSREKLLNHEPYPRMSQAFLNAIDNCDLAVFVGASMRDEHVSKAARDVARRVMTLVVNPEQPATPIPNAMPVGQTATEFLVSTLPALLRCDDIGEFLAANTKAEPAPLTGVLQAIVTACNEGERSELRMSAIEGLDGWGIVPDGHILAKLVQSSDPVVARYALGLVAGSVEAKDLVEKARSGSHLGDVKFRSELDLVVQMLRGS